MPDPAIRFEGVSRHFGEVKAVDDVTLEIADGEFFSMLGPSGSGKTTCLRMIAGFDRPTSGQIFLYGQDVSNLPPYERPVNTVFQDYALFPAHDRRREYRLRLDDQEGAASRNGRSRWMRCSTWCNFRVLATASHRSFPADSDSGSPWRGR